MTSRTSSQSSEATLKDLVVAGLLTPGMKLHARPGPWVPVECTVLANGDLELGGKAYSSPSGAGRQVRKGSTNGWTFWELPDGRRLRELRSELAAAPATSAG